MKVVASGRRRLTSSATARWSGPMTTASEAPAPFGAASSTCASSDWPATGCRTFGIADCMRVPSPAASTIVRLVLPVIRILIVWWRKLRRRRHKAFSLPMETCSSRGKTPRIPDRGAIPVNVYRLIRLRPQEGRERPMAKDSDHLAGSFDTENTGGFLTGLLAEEDNFDRRTLWRLGSWGAAAVGAVVVALMTNHSPIGLYRDQAAGTDLARQSQQIQLVAKESQNEVRRLASAIETLNGDRDRLYSRVTVLEQGLDSVTGAIARQNPAAASPQAAATASAATEPQSAPQTPVPAPAVSPVAAAPAIPVEKPAVDTATKQNPGPAPFPSVAQGTPNSPGTPTAMPLMASKSILAPPDAAPAKLVKPETPASAVTASPMPEVVAPVASADDAERDPPWAASSKVAVQRTEFGVDVGGANSLGGLRALWRGLKSNAALSALRPIIVVKESNTGLGMQLRLVAGPLADAAAAAKICAALLESQRPCETTVFDGQRLAMKAEEPPASVKPVPRRRSIGKRAAVVEEPPQKPETTLSSLFTRR